MPAVCHHLGGLAEEARASELLNMWEEKSLLQQIKNGNGLDKSRTALLTSRVRHCGMSSSISYEL